MTPSGILIPIYFTFDRHFVLAAGVAFDSLLRTASSRHRYALYVVHTDLQPRHRRRLDAVVARYDNAELHYIDASGYDTGWTGLNHKSHFSKEVFYKLTAAEMFPQYDRILFSDVDVIFTADISEAYFFRPEGDFYYAGTRPIQANPNLPRYRADFTPAEIDVVARYEVSAGFMLINLERLRRDNRQPQLMSYFRQNAWRLILPEQDCIALCLAPRIAFLDYKYVVCAHQYDLEPEALDYNPADPALAAPADAQAAYRRMLAEVVQLHYPGVDKPWNCPTVPRFDAWLRACRRAGLLGLYFRLQPMFVLQRWRRYNLKRFIRKILRRVGLAR